METKANVLRPRDPNALVRIRAARLSGRAGALRFEIPLPTCEGCGSKTLPGLDLCEACWERWRWWIKEPSVT